MRTSLVAVLLFLSFTASSQIVVEGVDINTQSGLEYVAISMVGAGSSYIVAVDYGAVVKSSYKHIEGQDGKPRKFNTHMDVLNFMYSQGWEYSGAHSTGNASWMIMRRKAGN